MPPPEDPYVAGKDAPLPSPAAVDEDEDAAGQRYQKTPRSLWPPDEARHAPDELTPEAVPTDAARSRSSSSLRIQLPGITAGQLAFSAMQFLPMPVLVLDSLKMVVLANEAMGRLLGMVREGAAQGSPDEASTVLDRLRGQSLTQVGIDLMQDGRVVWINWEILLDGIALKLATGKTNDELGLSSLAEGGGSPRDSARRNRASPPDHPR